MTLLIYVIKNQPNLASESQQKDSKKLKYFGVSGVKSEHAMHFCK